MASFVQNKSRQFSPYQPTIDSETMAKAVAKKDGDYQAGAAKVQNTLDAVAGLPVASERDRKYLQDKVSGITTSINQKVGTDYSDGRNVNQIADHVSLIANDPIIQSAVQSTSNAKALKTDQKADLDENGASATFNIQNSDEEFNNWLENGKLGEVFKGKHFGYIDTDKIFSDTFKQKHPNTKISIVSAGQVLNPKTGKLEFDSKKVNQMWDEEMHTWKGITPLDVKEELEGMIKERPDIQKQLDINAKYANKEVIPETLVQKKINVLKEQKNIITRNIDQIDEQLGRLKPDDKDYEDLNKKRKYLLTQKDAIDPYLTPEAKYAALYAYQENPDFLEQEKKSIYMDNWYNTQMKKYAYGEESVDFKGKGPTDKQEWAADHIIKIQELQLHKEARDDAHQKLLDGEAVARAKQTKEYSAFTTSEGVTGPNNDSFTSFQNTYDNARAELKDKKNTYLYNTYHSLFPNYFTVGEDKKPIPNSKEQDKLDDLYKTRYEAYKNGNNKDDKGNTVDLSRRDYDFFRDVEASDRVSLAMQGKIEEAKTAFNEQAKINKELSGFYSSLDNLNTHPIEVATKPGLAPDVKITGKDIEKYKAAYAELTNWYKKNEPSTFENLKEQFTNFSWDQLPSEVKADDKRKEIFNKYGLDPKVATEIPYNATQYLKGISNAEDSRSKFLSNYLEANDYVVNPQSTQWVDLNIKDPKTNDIIRQKAVKLLKSTSSKILSSKEPSADITISYVQEPLSGNYHMQVEDTKGGKETYPVASTDVPAEWKNYKDESTLSQLLRINRDPYTKLSNTYDNKSENSHTFRDALPLTNKEYNGKPTAIKYHVVQEGGNYYVEFWAKDITNPNDKGHILRDPKTKVALEASTTSLKELHSILDNFSKTGNVNPVGFSANLPQEDEEKDNQE